jgi:hypothetical protein
MMGRKEPCRTEPGMAAERSVAFWYKTPVARSRNVPWKGCLFSLSAHP